MMNDNDAVSPVTGGSEEPPPRLGLTWKILLGAGALLVALALLVPVFRPISGPATPPPATLVAEAVSPVTPLPETAAARFELGNTRYESGQFDQAIQAYLAALELDPNYQAVYANLGVVYYQQQKFDLAASQYEKALELDPQDGEVAYNLGVLYLQQALSKNDQPDPQLLDKAVTQLQQAQEISPNLAEPHFSLGVAYLALNQPQQAKTAFETFLALDPQTDLRAKQEAERYLKLLQDAP